MRTRHVPAPFRTAFATALVATVLAGVGVVRGQPGPSPRFVQFVFTSDAHYGITRTAFRGGTNVDARVVNKALVAEMNALGDMAFPKDGGLAAGGPIGPIDFIVEGGDVANREENMETGAIQSAATSWTHFMADYVGGITLADRRGAAAPLYVVPGNHEASNAVGFYHLMTPPVDKTAMAALFNWMIAPPVPRTTATFDYDKDKVLFSRDAGGIHFMYLQIWPDTQARAWMERDLRGVLASTPVILFTHDQPDVESKHFINPNGLHDVNDRDRFENLLSDRFADGTTVNVPSLIEQRGLETFLRRHQNISAYFHGNSNWNQFYDWTGPDHTIALHTFRVDSPMKGALSAADETRLSFQVVTIDTTARTMTVRECLWNTRPANPSQRPVWGSSTTVALQPRLLTHP
jgi:hypothetical protein